MLIINKINKKFNKIKVLHNVTFQAPSPGISGVVGPRGSGKSMLFKIICGLDTAENGSIIYNETVLSSLKQKRALFFFMPDEYQAYPDYLVSEYIEFINKIGGCDRDDLVTSLGIADYLNDKVERLTTCQRQHLKLYTALSHDREVVLIDEPFSGLDPVRINNVAEVFKAEKTAGKTIVVALQDLGHASKLCDTMALIHEGRIIAQGSISELAEDYEVYNGDLEEIFIKALVR